MKLKYDLHVHSVLSPCADLLMTPNNILNMAYLKELDYLSVTDHNSCLQYDALDKIKLSYNFLVIYGAEVTVKEGYHIVCYLETKEDMKKFQRFLEKNLEDYKITNPYLHHGIKCDEFDEEVEKLNIDFHRPLKACAQEVCEFIDSLGGFSVLAHIDRTKTGILGLGFYFDDLIFSGFELDNFENADCFLKKYPILKTKQMFRSSDAHSLEKINEPIYEIELQEKSVKALFNYMREKR